MGNSKDGFKRRSLYIPKTGRHGNNKFNEHSVLIHLFFVYIPPTDTGMTGERDRSRWL